MPEIGVTLREARMRAGIDIAEVESRTKIRAKYLRALENEEWSLLPGTTFVKSFLRTYAETLGLDAKLLVEEYKFRHEPYEASAGGQQGGGRRGRRGAGRGGAFGPPKRTNLLPIVLLVVVVAGAIFAVLQLSKSENDPAATTTSAERQAPQRRASEAQRIADRQARRARAAIVNLRITAPSNESTSVCVQNASGKTVLDRPELAAGRRTKVVRSKEFRVVTTSGARITDGGRRLRLPADSRNVIAYRVTKNGKERLSASRRPSCS
jgi:cytoskeletal protein RodZ